MGVAPKASVSLHCPTGIAGTSLVDGALSPLLDTLETVPVSSRMVDGDGHESVTHAFSTG